MRAKPTFEPHLVVHEMTLPGGKMWALGAHNWLFLRVKSGSGYWHELGVTRELFPGSVLVFAGKARGSLLASRLGEVVITYFSMDPNNLVGFLNLGELHSFKRLASLKNSSLIALLPDDPISERFKNISLNQGETGLSARLQLMQLFFELFGSKIETDTAERMQKLNGRERLRKSLTELPASELLGVSLSDLAPRMRCSQRHLSRLFREELGTSFREKQTELRLAKACQLLATSNAKLVEVALTSGYHSYSLFGQLFKKRFGVSPAIWRKQNRKEASRGQKPSRLLPL